MIKKRNHGSKENLDAGNLYSVTELQNQVNSIASMKSSALTKAIIRVSSIIPVRGIETLG